MTPQDNPPVVPAGSALTSQQAQVQQMRQTILSQVADLKQQIQIIQQNTLETMLSDIDNIFTAQLTNSLQQIADQQQSAQALPIAPAAPLTPAAPVMPVVPTAPAAPFSDNVTPQTPASYAISQAISTGSQAANLAVSNADEAMRSVQAGVQNTETPQSTPK